MKEALFWQGLAGDKVRCSLCPHECVIAVGKLGFCRARRNVGGALFNESYGAVTAMHADPIEKKPLYHFKPGSRVYSIGTYGCNLACDFCQNHEISQDDNPRFNRFAPEEMVEGADRSGCIGIAFTYSEPTTWIEFVMDVASINDGFNILVTNGYINRAPLDALIEHIDAVNVDVKGDEGFYRSLCHSPYTDIIENVRAFYEAGVHVEVTNLLIPSYNDSLDSIRALVDSLSGVSQDIPLHFSRFFPHFKMKRTSPTPIESLKKAYTVARDAGIRHVYLGNVYDGRSDTVCHKCGEVLVQRDGHDICSNKIVDGRCPICGEPAYGVW